MTATTMTTSTTATTSENQKPELNTAADLVPEPTVDLMGEIEKLRKTDPKVALKKEIVSLLDNKIANGFVLGVPSGWGLQWAGTPSHRRQKRNFLETMQTKIRQYTGDKFDPNAVDPFLVECYNESSNFTLNSEEVIFVNNELKMTCPFKVKELKVAKTQSVDHVEVVLDASTQTTTTTTITATTASEAPVVSELKKNSETEAPVVQAKAADPVPTPVVQEKPVESAAAPAASAAPVVTVATTATTTTTITTTTAAPIVTKPLVVEPVQPLPIILPKPPTAPSAAAPTSTPASTVTARPRLVRSPEPASLKSRSAPSASPSSLAKYISGKTKDEEGNDVELHTSSLWSFGLRSNQIKKKEIAEALERKLADSTLSRANQLAAIRKAMRDNKKATGPRLSYWPGELANILKQMETELIEKMSSEEKALGELADYREIARETGQDKRGAWYGLRSVQAAKMEAADAVLEAFAKNRVGKQKTLSEAIDRNIEATIDWRPLSHGKLNDILLSLQDAMQSSAEMTAKKKQSVTQ